MGSREWAPAGSSVIGVGGAILYWDNPIYLMDVGCIGGLGSWGVLVADGPSLLCGGSCFCYLLEFMLRLLFPRLVGLRGCWCRWVAVTEDPSSIIVSWFSGRGWRGDALRWRCGVVFRGPW